MKIRTLFAGLTLALLGANAALALDLGTVKGRLVDEKGQPLVGVVVTSTTARPLRPISATSALRSRASRRALDHHQPRLQRNSASATTLAGGGWAATTATAATTDATRPMPWMRPTFASARPRQSAAARA